MHGDVAHCKRIIAKMLAGLDVVLVAIGPMEMHFFAVVRNGVALVFGVPTLGDEIAVLVVAAKEGV